MSEIKMKDLEKNVVYDLSDLNREDLTDLENLLLHNV